VIRIATFVAVCALSAFCVQVLGITPRSAAVAGVGGWVLGAFGRLARSFRRRRT
jgi:hypothetical protein